MRSILKVIVSILLTFFIIFFGLMTLVKYYLLNPNLYIKSLNAPGVYPQIERSVKEGINDYVEDQLKRQGIDMDSLTVGERAILIDKIEQLTGIFTQERIKDLAENNIRNLFGYINGSQKKLILYFPLNSWGLPPEFRLAPPLNNLSEETDLEKLSEDLGEAAPITKEQIRSLKEIRVTIDNHFKLSLAGMVFGLAAALFISPTDKKISFAAKPVVISGVLMLALAGGFKLIIDSLPKRTPYLTNPAQILFTTVLPPFLQNILVFWLAISSITFIAGISGFFINAYLVKRKAGVFAKPQKKIQKK